MRYRSKIKINHFCSLIRTFVPGDSFEVTDPTPNLKILSV